MHLEEHADDGKHGQSAVGQPEVRCTRWDLKSILKAYWYQVVIAFFKPQYRLMLHTQYKLDVVLKYCIEG